jgi:hypothetical protein
MTHDLNESIGYLFKVSFIITDPGKALFFLTGVVAVERSDLTSRCRIQSLDRRRSTQRRPSCGLWHSRNGPLEFSEATLACYSNFRCSVRKVQKNSIYSIYIDTFKSMLAQGICNFPF